MPTFQVRTPLETYPVVVERGAIHQVLSFFPPMAGKTFVITTHDLWALHGAKLEQAFAGACRHADVLFFPGQEVNKRLEPVERLAEQMVELGADRTSIVVGFGGGIVTDVAGFLAAIFMRGIPVIQVPTTLLAQVDAAVGGKTGVNLTNGKNLIGSFHQPLAVVVDPDLVATLSEREFRAGLYEIIKCGVIRDRDVFNLCATQSHLVMAMQPALIDELIAAAVRIKCEVVSADEREGGLRRILNFGHTIGHALEAETEYKRFLHGEAVALGMIAATHLAVLTDKLSVVDAGVIIQTISDYGSLPPAADLDPDRLLTRLSSDKKTLQGKVHFVLPTRIGDVTVTQGIEPQLIRQAMLAGLADL